MRARLAVCGPPTPRVTEGELMNRSSDRLALARRTRLMRTVKAALAASFLAALAVPTVAHAGMGTTSLNVDMANVKELRLSGPINISTQYNPILDHSSKATDEGMCSVGNAGDFNND